MTALASIYQLAKLGDKRYIQSYGGQKIYSKLHPDSCTNTHYDVTNLVNHRMFKNTKTLISWE